MKKLLLLLITIALLSIGWYLLSPLFIDNVIDESFPVASNDNIDQFKNLTEADVDSLPIEERDKLQRKMNAVGLTMPDTIMKDSMPTDPKLLSIGTFSGADSFHEGAGKVSIYQLKNEERILRFEDFNVTNGPALRVYLTKASNGNIEEGFIDLGELKGNKGDQNYQLPSDTSISEYQSVIIYCKPFRVTFAIAELQ